MRRGVSVFKELDRKFPGSLQPTISDVRIVHMAEACLLEIWRRPHHAHAETVERMDLPVSGDDGKEMFTSDNDIEANAARVLELDEYTLITVTNLFTEKAARAISGRYEGARDSEG